MLGETALRAVIGSPEVMDAQVTHLVRLGESIDIRVRPFTMGAHPWLAAGSFAILRFTGYPAVIYTETHIDARYMETARELTEYAEIFGRLHESSIPIKEFAP